MYLFLDTETTGVTPQDRIVSICSMFYDYSGQNISSLYVLVRPEGFSIPLSATAIHGITSERAMRDGFALADVLNSLDLEILRLSPKLLIGHNIAFDRTIILNEYARSRKVEHLSRLSTFCTMKETTSLCRIPGRYGDFKWPRLAELHKFLFGTTHSDAHSAQADVEACANCFFELKRLGHVLH
jgi:DNA polymerase-3 subunit epsilon